jgi:hypothetical protein
MRGAIIADPSRISGLRTNDAKRGQLPADSPAVAQKRVPCREAALFSRANEIRIISLFA